ncbi:cobalamin biosynthesis protein CobD [Corynebacterium sp. sy017]|uniref:adenosylcobinamide-phosphate synthase CbiB n=1 Tax=unclassified Corynebacterium TaxID=2624378 RepID=UPI001185B872|nr:MULTISPECIES: adenosylcobinamide-phosphate synthase CbiB [unclassified Corynebacterium]MBP3088035.1 cobalamin biosynthesis protein CobD [Corynebacterium sp. sy017]TSD92564.1 cobalamin biosynthesis protein CobD [Corynebacterium sp. SY003]
MFRGLLAGVIADRIIGDPGGRLHPVALFGSYAAQMEKICYRPTKAAGATYVCACILPPTLVVALWAKKRPQLALALGLWSSLGGTTLEKIGQRVHDELAQDNITAARALIPWLCSRDPEALDRAGIIRATVESLAENTSDAAIAPLFFAACGRYAAVAVVVHRLANTLDAMVGYRSQRYAQFGYAAAKFDDVLAFIPARITALSHLAYGWVHGNARRVLGAWRTDAAAHPSPNAGVVEATAAGALGVQLGGKTQYAHGVEQRPTLGSGNPPQIHHIQQAVTLSRWDQRLVTITLVSIMIGARITIAATRRK